jgi:TPP-dependent pyruvate/acetoin dehydrogenase alpha subunit
MSGKRSLKKWGTPVTTTGLYPKDLFDRAPSAELIKANSKVFRDIFVRMEKIRQVEEAIAEEYPKGEMRCPTHLSIGQEAVAATVGALLNPTDYAISTHRAHAHYVGKGGDINRMMAEIFGKATGCAQGKGGSMHLIDKSVSFMGSTAIVGNSIPLGAGLAMAAQLEKSNKVSCIFLGDGAVEEGAFYETVNFAVLKNLPVLFVCENNFYSVYSPLKVRQPEGRFIHEMVSGLGIKTDYADGNNPLDCFVRLKTGIDQIRAGKGPYFIELYTYRWREHCGPYFDNDIGYRTEEEYQEWLKRDPILNFEKRLLDGGYLSKAEREDIKKTIAAEVREALVFARSSPFPEAKEAFTGVFAEGSR